MSHSLVYLLHRYMCSKDLHDFVSFLRSPVVIMEFGRLAKSWDNCSIIRGRFRRDMSWLQWPIPGKKKPGPKPDVSNPKNDPRVPCTRAVELNVPILSVMLDHCTGELVNVHDLAKEVLWLKRKAHTISLCRRDICASIACTGCRVVQAR